MIPKDGFQKQSIFINTIFLIKLITNYYLMNVNDFDNMNNTLKTNIPDKYT